MTNRLGAVLDEWAAAKGEGVTVALLDTGVEVDHPAFEGAEVECLGFADDGEQVHVRQIEGVDRLGHGTAAAARILAVAPRARILSCRIFSPSFASTSRLTLGALGWLLKERDVDVINLSLGTPNREFGLELAHMVDNFYARGIPVVASEGPAGRPDYPAIFATPISVALSKAVSDFEFIFRAGELVEFGAAGDGVVVPSPGGSWCTASGSSYAAPIISGHLARLKSINRDLRVWELKALLQYLAR